MSPALEKKIKQAVRLIQSSVGNRVVEVSYSGGKDSDVILELTKMAGVKYRAIYKNTTIDPSGTIAHCRNNGVEILQPELSYFKIVEKKGMPTRRARFCCSYLKEYKVLDIAIHGIRRSESVARSSRYSESEPVICRLYGSKEKHVSVILPILAWTDLDVAEFISDRKIKCHSLYYDECGNFHPERRLGCIGCPMKSDAGVLDYKRHPRFFRLMVKACKIWWDNNPQLKSHDKFKSVYGLIANNLFFSSYSDWKIANDGLFGQTDWKTLLENYFSVKL